MNEHPPQEKIYPFVLVQDLEPGDIFLFCNEKWMFFLAEDVFHLNAILLEDGIHRGRGYCDMIAEEQWVQLIDKAES